MIMTSLCAAAAAPPSAHLGFRRPAIGAKIATITVFKLRPRVSPSVNFRFKDGLKFQVRQGLYKVRASDPRNSAGNSIIESSDGSSGDAQGPPLLTILAGLVVFALMCWIVGSIAIWLIGFIANFLSSK